MPTMCEFIYMHLNWEKKHSLYLVFPNFIVFFSSDYLIKANNFNFLSIINLIWLESKFKYKWFFFLVKNVFMKMSKIINHKYWMKMWYRVNGHFIGNRLICMFKWGNVYATTTSLLHLIWKKDTDCYTCWTHHWLWSVCTILSTYKYNK